MGVHTLFLLEAGLNIFEVFIANAVFTGSMLGQTGLGRLAQTQSIASGYILGGMVSVLVLVLPVMILLRRRDEPADIIMGTAGEYGFCAAEGIPNVSAVYTTPIVSEV